MSGGRNALLVATYAYKDAGLRRLTSPAHDAEALAQVLEDPAIAGFDVTMLVNEPHHVVGEAIADFYAERSRDDLALLYFTGHGVKDDDGRLYLAMADTRREALLFTGISAAQVSDAMDACRSRRKVLVLDCCYSGAFPAGRASKSDEGVQTLERFQGKGRAVLTASDATQYAFEGDDVQGSGTQSLFTRFLVEAIRSGEADLDEDGDIALDELYSYVHERVVAEMPQQRPKKQEDVDGRIVIARNVHWRLPEHLRAAVESPLPAQRLAAVDGLAHLYRVGNEIVRATARQQLALLAEDDSRAVSAAATARLSRLGGEGAATAGHEPAADDAAGAPPSTPPPEPTEPPRPHPARPDQPDPAALRAEVRVTRPTGPPSGGGEPSDPEVPHPHGHAAAVPLTTRRGPVLAALITAAVLLTGSRLLVFESNNGYRATAIGWSSATWAAEVTVPLLLAAGLLLTPRNREIAIPVATGLLAGAVLALGAELLHWFAGFSDRDYVPGPGMWALVTGTIVLTVGVAVAVSSPWARTAPRLRVSPVAVAAELAVLAALGIWLFAVGATEEPIRSWLFAKGAGVLFTLVCVPVVVVRLRPAQRLLALAALTTFALSLEVAGIGLVLHQAQDYDIPSVVRAILAVLLALAACYAAQLSPDPHRASRTLEVG